MRALFKWEDRYGLGIPSIDDEHRHFFELVNKIFDASEKEAVSADDVMALVDALSDYAAGHLAGEERRFVACGYPGAIEHTRAHNYFRERIQELALRLREKRGDVRSGAAELAEFAGTWFVRHVLEMDKEYAQFLIDCGVR